MLELTDKHRIEAWLAAHAKHLIEARDENAIGMEGIVSIFLESGACEARNGLVVRWAQAARGLRHAATLVASRVSGLDRLLSALPLDRGPVELSFPFWSSPAIGAELAISDLGAEAEYRTDRESLVSAPAADQVERVLDLDLVRPMFRKLAVDMPAYVLSLRGALTAVAVVTHQFAGVGRVQIYTVEEARARGFGRAVLTALANALITCGLEPSLSIDLASEPAVRLAERAGFFQNSSNMRCLVNGRRVDTPDPAQGTRSGLVERIGKRR